MSIVSCPNHISTYSTTIDSVDDLSQNTQTLVDSGTFRYPDGVLSISRLVVLGSGEVN